MDRVLKGTTATIAATFAVDGAATDPSPDTAVLELARAVGTDVLPPGSATVNAGTGLFTRLLTPADTANLDSLRALWTATMGGQAQTIETRVEVVGGFLFTLAEGLAALPGLTGTAAEKAAQVAALRVRAEQDLERACRGLAFVPRYCLERRPVPRVGRCTLRVSHGPVRSVRSVSVDGVAWSAEQVAAVVPGTLSVESPYGWYWRRGSQPVVIGYEYGLDAPERPVTDAALTLAVLGGSSTGIDPRATRVDTQDGSLTLAVGDDDSFGVPAIDRLVADYRLRLVA